MKPETKVERLPEAERALLQEAFAVAQETGIKTVDFAAQRLRAVLTIGHTLNHWRKQIPYLTWTQSLEERLHDSRDHTTVAAQLDAARRC